VVATTTLTKEISGDELHLEQVAALVVRGRDVRLEGAVVVGPVAAENDVALRNGGCGPVRAGGDVTIEQGGCGPVRAGAVSIRQGGCGPVRAERVTIAADGTAGVVVAREVTVEAGGVVQRQLPATAGPWLGAGAAAGGLAGLLVGALLGRRR
jgi:hypothetical protein